MNTKRFYDGNINILTGNVDIIIGNVGTIIGNVDTIKGNLHSIDGSIYGQITDNIYEKTIDSTKQDENPDISNPIVISNNSENIINIFNEGYKEGFKEAFLYFQSLFYG